MRQPQTPWTLPLSPSLGILGCGASVLGPRGCVPSGCLTISDRLGSAPVQRRGRAASQRAPGPLGWLRACMEQGQALAVCVGGLRPGGSQAWPAAPPWPGSLASSALLRGPVHSGALWAWPTSPSSCGDGACRWWSPQANLGVLTGRMSEESSADLGQGLCGSKGTLPHSPPRASVSPAPGVRTSQAMHPDLQSVTGPPLPCR